MDINQNLIEKYLAGKASDEEKEQVRAWLATEEGQTYLKHLMMRESELETYEDYDLGHAIPVEKMKQRFMYSIEKRHTWKSRWVVAAVFVPFVLMAGFVSFVVQRISIFPSKEYITVSSTCGEQIRVVLQDGTVVMMNSNSQLRYPKAFGLFSREVELRGEAYFDVEKDTKRPFLLKTQGVTVRVTGTQFNAKAYPEDSLIQVYLVEGGVQLLKENLTAYTLYPGQYASYNKLDDKCSISIPSPLSAEAVTSWKEGKLSFRSVALGEILKALERKFGVVFVADSPELLQVHFSLSFSGQKIGEILGEMEHVSDIRFTSLGNGRYRVALEN